MYKVTYWHMNGKEDIQLKEVRINRKAEIEQKQLIETRPNGTDLVALERTSIPKRMSYFPIYSLWQSSRYKDLNER